MKCTSQKVMFPTYVQSNHLRTPAAHSGHNDHNAPLSASGLRRLVRARPVGGRCNRFSEVPFAVWFLVRSPVGRCWKGFLLGAFGLGFGRWSRSGLSTPEITILHLADGCVTVLEAWGRAQSHAEQHGRKKGRRKTHPEISFLGRGPGC